MTADDMDVLLDLSPVVFTHTYRWVEWQVRVGRLSKADSDRGHMRFDVFAPDDTRPTFRIFSNSRDHLTVDCPSFMSADEIGEAFGPYVTAHRAAFEVYDE